MVFQGNICRNFGPVMFFVLFEFKIWLLDISVYKNNGLTWYRNLDLIVGMVIGWGCEVITSCSSYQRCGRWRTSKFLLWDVTLAGEFFPPRILLLFLWSLALPEAQGFDLTVLFAVYTDCCCKFCGRGALLSSCSSGLFPTRSSVISNVEI